MLFDELFKKKDEFDKAACEEKPFVKKEIYEMLIPGFDSYVFGTARFNTRKPFIELLMSVFTDKEIFKLYDEAHKTVVFEYFLGLFYDQPGFIFRNAAELVNKRDLGLDFVLAEAKKDIKTLDDVNKLLDLGVDSFEVYKEARARNIL